jgi:hypothetical protein
MPLGAACAVDTAEHMPSTAAAASKRKVFLVVGRIDIPSR